MTINKQLSKPAVSVCIPTYMGSKYIGAAIESVLMQTFTDFELIIIDDNSSDDISKVIARFDDSRILFLRNEQRLGPEGNWNRCLSEARGRYFKLLPQDDLLASDCLEKQVAVLEADMDMRVAFVFCARTIIDPNGRTIMSRHYPRRGKGHIDRNTAMLACLRRGTNLIGEPGGVLFRKNLADGIGGFDGSIGYVIDLDYWFRLLVVGEAYYLPESLVSFRISPNSWSVAISKEQSRAFQLFVSKITENSLCNANRSDIICGKIMASINRRLRMLIYRIIR